MSSLVGDVGRDVVTRSIMTLVEDVPTINLIGDRALRMWRV